MLAYYSAMRPSNPADSSYPENIAAHLDRSSHHVSLSVWAAMQSAYRSSGHRLRVVDVNTRGTRRRGTAECRASFNTPPPRRIQYIRPTPGAAAATTVGVLRSLVVHVAPTQCPNQAMRFSLCGSVSSLLRLIRPREPLGPSLSTIVYDAWPTTIEGRQTAIGFIPTGQDLRELVHHGRLPLLSFSRKHTPMADLTFNETRSQLANSE